MTTWINERTTQSAARKVRATVLGVVAWFAFGISSSALAQFWSGVFDPPDLSGTHVFHTINCPPGFNFNNGDTCSASIDSLTATLDHAHPLNIGSVLTFPDFFDVLDVTMNNADHLIGVDTRVMGPFSAPGGAPYTGPWWIQYDFTPPCTVEVCLASAIDVGPQLVSPGQVVFLFACPGGLGPNGNGTGEGNCLPSDTAFTVSFEGPFATPPSIPEPGTIALLLAGLGGAVASRRKRTRQR